MTMLWVGLCSLFPSLCGNYVPGKLAIEENGLILSEGLTSRVIAEFGKHVVYASGEESARTFHERPDAGATFLDPRPGNEGGWMTII